MCCFVAGDQLEAMVSERRSICYRDILSLMHTPGQPGGKLLILRPRLYKIVPGPSALSANDPRLTAPDAVVIDATPLIKGLSGAGGGGAAAAAAAGAEGGGGGVSVFEMDGRLLKLPPSASAAMRKDQVEALVADALRGQ